MSQMTIQQALQMAFQHHQAGRLREAEPIYRQILSVQPDHPDVLHLMGILSSQAGRADVSVEFLRRRVALAPESAAIYVDLGTVLRATGQIEPAIAAFERAAALQPDLLNAHNSLAVTLHQYGRLDDAVQAYRRVLALRPDFHEARNNLGTALMHKGQIEDAIAVYRETLRLRPDEALTHHNLGMVLLMKGDFANGWAEYEWRTRSSELGTLAPNLAKPRWDGSDLTGRRILLHMEQGAGDTFHFARYAPMLRQRGARIILACRPETVALMRSLAGVEQFVTTGDPMPEFDVHCSLLSLPLHFKTTLDNIPANVPYLHADPALVNHWRPRVAGLGGRLKIGLVWAGRPDQPNDRNRSMSLDTLAPLAQAPGITFVSLQKGAASDQARNPPAGLNLVDWTSELTNFSDTAALIETLDLVLTVDTSVAHLAGALGKPVWVMLAYVADWRYLLNREDSPWYPTMRLFRQSRIGDWQQPIQRVVQSLRSLVNGSHPLP